MSDKRTVLPSQQEMHYQMAMRKSPWYQEFQPRYGEKPSLDDQSYDMRAAWAAGIKPERDPYDKHGFMDPGAYHWPDFTPQGQQLKSDDHPTLWMGLFQNATGQNPEALGLKDAAQAQQWLQAKGLDQTIVMTPAEQKRAMMARALMQGGPR